MILYDHQLKEAKFNIEEKRIHHKRKDKKKKSDIRRKCYDIFTFDIEVTSGWIKDDGSITGYYPGMPEEYWNGMQPFSLCYLWQFSFNDQVYYGRDLKDFLQVLKDLPEDIECVIWVFNLSYEFHFLIDVLTLKSVFARSPHHPMKCTFKEFPRIEFRCAYVLENTKLENWGNDLGIKKLVGQLDYESIRTPLTPLTPEELEYGEHDCLIVYEGIKKELEVYNDVYNIPLTSTGKIRRDCKERIYKDGYDRYIKKQVPSLEIYKILQGFVFAGGYTHANRYHANKTITGLIEHYDFTSSYPAVMVAFKYPVGRWTYRTETFIPKDKTFENYAFIFKLHFENVCATTLNTYIQVSRIFNQHNIVNDNGRVVSGSFDIYVTEYDWMIIKDHYQWDRLILLDSWYSKKDYLPKEFIKYILELYVAKTKYKGLDEYEDVYRRSKQFLNSLFGMSVTSIIQADCDFVSGEWFTKNLTSDAVEKRLKDLSNTYRRNDTRYFLSYSWGCWITSIARYTLWKCINIAGDLSVCYCDTDSIFAVGHHDFSSYNNWITEKLEATCRHYRIDTSMLCPEDKKGVKHPLGVFDKEPDLCEFRTLHAKCYCMREAETKELSITVAGINKGAVAMLHDDIDNFVAGFNFDKDDASVSKRMHTYISDQPDITFDDGYISHYRNGINIRRTGYKLGMSDDYERLLEFFADAAIDNISEITKDRLRGYFEYG